MLTELKGRIKVDKKIQTLIRSKRKAPELNIGYDYFVCFHNNNVYPCTLIEIINEFKTTEVRIEIPMKKLSAKGFMDSSGKISHRWMQQHIVLATSIGSTPEEAVKNMVT